MEGGGLIGEEVFAGCSAGSKGGNKRRRWKYDLLILCSTFESSSIG